MTHTHTYTHTHIHTYTYTHKHTQTHTLHTRTNTHPHTRAHTHTRTHTQAAHCLEIIIKIDSFKTLDFSQLWVAHSSFRRFFGHKKSTRWPAAGRAITLFMKRKRLAYVMDVRRYTATHACRKALMARSVKNVATAALIVE